MLRDRYEIQIQDKLLKIIKKIGKRNFVIIAIIILLIFVYLLFFKPNPWLRYNIDQLRAEKSESALSIESPDEINGVGKKFTVKINVDTMGNSVNAVQSYLKFDSKIIEVSDSKTASSFCKFYPENNFDNSKGIVRLSCGSPYPGFRGTNTLQEIEFNTKLIQTTKIYFSDDSMVLANDGKGTNLLREFPSKEITIKAGI